MTQKQTILKHLMDHGSITTREAMLEYGIYRLAARIPELEKDGYIIKHEMVSVPTRNGSTEVARYTLEVE